MRLAARRAWVRASLAANSALSKAVLFRPNSMARPFNRSSSADGHLCRGAGQDLRPLVTEQNGVGEEEIAAPGAHQPGQQVEAHAGPDHDLAVAAQARHLVAAGPARRKADPHHVAAMVAPVVRHAGAIDDTLPGGIDVARKNAVLE